MNKKGFTLIELLIVITIITIVATIGIKEFYSQQNKEECSFRLNEKCITE